MALKDIYKYLQQYAVGLEQVVIDQKASGSTYKDKFDYDEILLRNVSTNLLHYVQKND